MFLTRRGGILLRGFDFWNDGPKGWLGGLEGPSGWGWNLTEGFWEKREGVIGFVCCYRSGRSYLLFVTSLSSSFFWLPH